MHVLSRTLLWCRGMSQRLTCVSNVCKLAFTWYNSPSAHTLKRSVFQSCSSRTYIDSYHTKSSPVRAKDLIYMWPHGALGEVKLPWAMILPETSLDLQEWPWPLPTSPTLTVGCQGGVHSRSQQQHPFQGNPCQYPEGNVPLLLHLSSPVLFERQEISCTLPFKLQQKFLYRWLNTCPSLSRGV